MTAFDWLVVAHLLGDFVLQSDKMAQKEQLVSALGLHLLAYGLVQGVVLAFLAPDLAVWAACIGWLLVTHAVVDSRHPVRLWMRAIGIAPDRRWLRIVLDQVFHLLTLVPVAVWLDGLAG
jgi:hypothetical protein